MRKTIFVCETGNTAVLRCQFRGGAVCCAKARVTCEMFLSVAMATAEGASIPKVAEELGISDQTLRNWIKQKTTGTPLAPTNGKVDDESMKFLGLETENRRLKKEMLQLKKWEALQKPSLILRHENFCLLHKLNFCANDCSGYF